MKRLMNWWRARRRPTALKVEAINEARLREMFLNAPNNPLWQATLAALDVEVQECLNDVIDETLTNEQMRFRLGSVQGLLQFKATLLEHERAARAMQEKINADAA